VPNQKHQTARSPRCQSCGRPESQASPTWAVAEGLYCGSCLPESARRRMAEAKAGGRAPEQLVLVEEVG